MMLLKNRSNHGNMLKIILLGKYNFIWNQMISRISIVIEHVFMNLFTALTMTKQLECRIVEFRYIQLKKRGKRILIYTKLNFVIQLLYWSGTNQISIYSFVGHQILSGKYLCIFRTRTNLTIFKKLYRKQGGIGRLEEWSSTVIDKSMESRIGTTIALVASPMRLLVFCIYWRTLSCRDRYLSTKVHNQAFHIMTW